jgi:GNAT superfamily N-acetyltransferase
MSASDPTALPRLATPADLPALLSCAAAHPPFAGVPAGRMAHALELLLAHPERGYCLMLATASEVTAFVTVSLTVSLQAGGRCALIADCVGSDEAAKAALLHAAIAYARGHGILRVLLASDGIATQTLAQCGFTQDAASLWRHSAVADGKWLG